MWLGSVEMVRPHASRSRALRSQMTISPGLTPACCRRSANRHDQRRMRGDSFAAEAVDLEADHLAHGHDALPRLDGLVVAGVAGDGAIEQGGDALLVEGAVGCV